MPDYQTADWWIDKLKMQPHPEGGYYAETWRSGESISRSCLPPRYGGDRSFSTGIYFLVKGGTFSSLHRIASDEMWHFYAGSPLTVFVIDQQDQRREILLGPDPDKGQVFQAVVPGGCWFGSRPQTEDGFSLVGCTVAPGFDFEDFELAGREKLLARYPEHSQLIHSLTRQND